MSHEFKLTVVLTTRKDIEPTNFLTGRVHKYGRLTILFIVYQQKVSSKPPGPPSSLSRELGSPKCEVLSVGPEKPATF